MPMLGCAKITPKKFKGRVIREVAILTQENQELELKLSTNGLLPHVAIILMQSTSLIQKDIVKEHKNIVQTSAESELTRVLNGQRERHEEVVAELHKDMEAAFRDNDHGTREQLEEEIRSKHERILKLLLNTCKQCGGAHSRARPASYQRRKRTAKCSGPSVHTGVQYEKKKRKAGSRITNANTFVSGGKALNGGAIDEKQEASTGFRKKAGRRIQTLKTAFASSASASSSHLKSEPTTDSESESDAEPLETDHDRRRTMLESIGGQELDEMKAEKYDFSDDFRLPGETAGDSCSIHKIERPGAAASTDAQPGSSTRPSKHRRVEDEEVSVTKKLRTSGAPRPDKTEDQPDGWNCLVYPTSQNTWPVLFAALPGEILSGWAETKFGVG
ncbi:hypothetical protein EDB19DRAFT_1825017 [Suillus lakei]|nr:hypothetical protein EDB19DRAFT_1825017 [Suillus lakei]